MQQFKSLISSLCVVVALTSAALAQQSPEPLASLAGRPDAEGQELLGGKYENPSAGIAFATPSNCKQIKGNGSDEIVRFINEQRNWDLVATKSTSAEPMPLSAGEGPDAKGKM